MSNDRKTILVTGAAGNVGRALRPYLRERYQLRLFDLAPIQDLVGDECSMVGDMTRADDVLHAVDGVDGIIHLACAHGTGIDFDSTVKPNYHAPLYLLEAAAKHRVGRFIFASSHHVLGQYRADSAEVFDNLPVAPDSYYGMSKVFGEAACATYAHRFGMAVTVIRIGNADPRVSDARRLRIWVSARDLAQLVDIGLSNDQIRYEVLYGVSESPKPLFSNARARELGYLPQDNAQDFLADDFTDYADMSPDLSGRDYVGGAYAGSLLASNLERA